MAEYILKRSGQAAAADAVLEKLGSATWQPGSDYVSLPAHTQVASNPIQSLGSHVSPNGQRPPNPPFTGVGPAQPPAQGPQYPGFYPDGGRVQRPGPPPFVHYPRVIRQDPLPFHDSGIIGPLPSEVPWRTHDMEKIESLTQWIEAQERVKMEYAPTEDALQYDYSDVVGQREMLWEFLKSENIDNTADVDLQTKSIIKHASTEVMQAHDKLFKIAAEVIARDLGFSGYDVVPEQIKENLHKVVYPFIYSYDINGLKSPEVYGRTELLRAAHTLFKDAHSATGKSSLARHAERIILGSAPSAVIKNIFQRWGEKLYRQPHYLAEVEGGYVYSQAPHITSIDFPPLSEAPTLDMAVNMTTDRYMLAEHNLEPNLFPESNISTIVRSLNVSRAMVVQDATEGFAGVFAGDEAKRVEEVARAAFEKVQPIYWRNGDQRSKWRSVDRVWNQRPGVSGGMMQVLRAPADTHAREVVVQLKGHMQAYLCQKDGAIVQIGKNFEIERDLKHEKIQAEQADEAMRVLTSATSAGYLWQEMLQATYDVIMKENPSDDVTLAQNIHTFLQNINNARVGMSLQGTLDIPWHLAPDGLRARIGNAMPYHMKRLPKYVYAQQHGYRLVKTYFQEASSEDIVLLVDSKIPPAFVAGAVIADAHSIKDAVKFLGQEGDTKAVAMQIH